MTPSRQTLTPDDLQEVLDSATNAGLKGTQQFLTPPALAQAIAIPLPHHRQVAADFTLGTGALLAGMGARHRLGVDIDSRAIRTVEESTEPNATWSAAPADFTLLFDLLAEADCRFDLLALNPPFSLNWDNKRFAALGKSEVDAVRACHRAGAATIDSTSATLLAALDRLTYKGDGYLLCNEATAIRLLGAPGKGAAGPLAAARRHIWLWLSLPEGTFPDARFSPCVLYFSPSHEGTEPLHLVSPTADPRTLLAPIARQRAQFRRGYTLHSEHDFDTTTLPKWRACLAEYRTLHGRRATARPFNLWLEAGKIQRHLTPFQHYSARIPRADAMALDGLHQQSPFALVMQKETRLAMLRAVRGTLWRVDPTLLTAVDEAMASYHAVRAPLYPLNDVQRLGWLDEEDAILCKLPLTEKRYITGWHDQENGVVANPGTDRMGDCVKFHETTGWPRRLVQQRKTDMVWIGMEDSTLRLAKMSKSARDKANWLHKENFESEEEALEWLLDDAGRDRGDTSTPCFLAGQSYSISCASRTLERPHQRPNAVTGRMEDCTLHGQELVVRITDAKGRVHEFGDFTPAEAAQSTVPCHSIEELVRHFEIPAVADVSQVHAESYGRYMRWLHRLEGSGAGSPEPAPPFPVNEAATAPHDAVELDETASRIQAAIHNKGFRFRRYQKEDMARGAVHGGCVLGWEPGLGKTLPLLLFGVMTGARRHLLVAPEGLHDQIVAEARNKFGIEVRRLAGQDAFLADPLLRQWQADHLAGRESAVRGAWITSYSQLGYNGGDEWEPREDDNGDLVVSKKILRERHAWPGWNPEHHDTGIGETRRGIRCVCRPSLATLAAPCFDYVGCDEAVRLKANESYTSLGVRRLNPRHRLVLTGTPIKNHLDDIFWLLWWAAGGHPEPTARFPYAGTNADKEKFAREFMFVEENHTRADEAEARTGVRRTFKKRIPLLCNLHRLWKLIGPLVARRRKDDIGEDIVPKTIVPITVRPGHAQQTVYQHHLLNPPDFTKAGKPMNPISKILAQISNLRLAALCPDSPLLSFRRVHLQAVREVLKPREPGEQAASEAATSKAIKIVKLADRTPFEGERDAALNLLDQMLAGDHPPDVEALCAAAPSLAEAIRGAVRIETQAPEARSWTDHNPKQAAILAKVAELLAIGEQVVVMAPFQDFGRSLQRRLEEAGVASLLLDGDMPAPKRGRMAALFKKRAYAVLIGGIKSMGEGHSFECASHLILPSIDWAYDQNRQAEDRVHRLTSSKPVTIYAMVTENTVDVRLAGLYREKGDASSLALDGRIRHDDTKEISLAELLREAVENFDPAATTISERDIEKEWEKPGGLRERLGLAMRRFREWHPPIDGTAPVTQLEIADALAALAAPAAGEPPPKSPPRVAPPSACVLKGVPDATLRFLLGVSPSMDVGDARAAFERFAAGRTGDWRRLWGEFEQGWKKRKPKPLLPPTDNASTRAAFDALGNIDL